MSTIMVMPGLWARAFLFRDPILLIVIQKEGSGWLQDNNALVLVDKSFFFFFKSWMFCIISFFKIHFNFIVLEVQFSAFSPYLSPQPQPFAPPSPDSTCPWFCPCVLYNCSCKPFTLCRYNPLSSPLWALLFSIFSIIILIWVRNT